MSKKLSLLITSIMLFVLNIALSFNSRIFFIALIILGITTYLMFGYEKDSFRYKKDIFIKIITYTLFYYFISYLSGLFFGFVKTGFSLSLINIIKNTVPVIFVIIISEFTRYMLIEKNRKSVINLILITILFFLIDLNYNAYAYNLSSSLELLKFIMVVALPAIFKNLLLTYLCFNVGYKTTITYRILMECLIYFVPFVTKFGIYIGAIIEILTPCIIALLVYQNYKKVKNKKINSRSLRERSYILFIITVLIILPVICLTSGVFKYQALTIGSGSMTGSINKGDVIIVNKLTDKEKTNIVIGDVLVFNYNNKVIVHRVINIIELDTEKVFYTKGDYNESEDGYPIYYDSIIGITSVRIPYIGYPTIWLSEALGE